MSNRRTLLACAVLLALLMAGIGLRLAFDTSAAGRSPEGAAVAGRTDPAASSSRPPDRSATPTKPEGDGIKITFRPAGASRPAAPAAGGLPPYPWALSPAVRATEDRLTHQLADMEFTDAMLDDILAEVSRLLGVPVELLDRAAGEKRITFQMRGILLLHVLKLLVRQYSLDFAIAEDGRIVVGAPGAVQDPPAIATLRTLQRARESEAGEERSTSAEADRQVEEQLRRTGMSVDFREAPLADAVSFVRETAGINIVIALQDPERVMAAKVTLSRQGMTAGEVLNELARQAECDVVIDRGLATILTREEAEAARARHAAAVAQVEGVLSRHVAFDGPELPAHRWATALREQTGTGIVVSEEIWTRAEALPLPTGGGRLDEALNHAARQAGWQWRLMNGVVYVY